METILAGILEDFDTLEAKPREYRQALDDIISTTSAKYVTQSKAGFFPDRTQPAFLCMRCAVFLCRATQKQGAEQVEMLEAAMTDLEKAEWDGVDMNTKMVKPNFLQLRHDADARKPGEYNQALGELYNCAGEFFMQARQHGGAPEIENMFTAISQLMLACSIPHEPPFGVTDEERSGAIVKAVNMIRFALRTSKRKAGSN